MKICPKCGAQFGDEMSYCLNDGGQLVQEASSWNVSGDLEARSGERTFELPANAPPVTEAFESATKEEPATTAAYTPPVYSPSPSKGKSSRAKYVVPLVLLGLAGIVIIAAAAIGLFLYMRMRNVDIASANANTVNRSITNQNDNIAISNASNLTSPPPVNISNGNANVESKPTQTPKKTPTPTPDRTTGDQPPPSYPTPSLQAPAVPGKRDVPKTIGGGVLNGKAISLPKPPYPPAARAVGASGSVSVQVLIDETGRVVSATAVSGHPLLRAAAESAARGARFSPTMLSGQPVKVSGIITYNFVP